MHHVQDTPKFKTNEKILDLRTSIPSEIFDIVFFPNTFLEIESTLKSIILPTDFHQDHVFNLSLHFEDSSKI